MCIKWKVSNLRHTVKLLRFVPYFALFQAAQAVTPCGHPCPTIPIIPGKHRLFLEESQALWLRVEWTLPFWAEPPSTEDSHNGFSSRLFIQWKLLPSPWLCSAKIQVNTQQSLLIQNEYRISRVLIWHGDISRLGLGGCDAPPCDLKFLVCLN